MKKFLSILGMGAMLLIGTMATPTEASAQPIRYRMVKTTTTNNSIDTINTATSTYFNGMTVNSAKPLRIQVDVTKYSGTVNIIARLKSSSDPNSTHNYALTSPGTGNAMAAGDSLSFSDASGTQTKFFYIPTTARSGKDYQLELISTGTQGVTVKCYMDALDPWNPCK